MRSPRRRASSSRCQTLDTNGSTRGAIVQQRLAQRGAVDLRRAEAAQQRVVVLQQHVDALAQGLRRRQVADADGAAGDLVLVGRADAAAGGADLALAWAAASRRRSSVPWSGRMSGAFSAISRLSGVTLTPCPRSASISFSSAQGSTTTPLPMIESLPGRTMPEGSRLSL